MKVIKKFTTKSGAIIYSIRLNKEELKILQEIVGNSLMWIPKTFGTMLQRGRLKNISNILSSALKGKRTKLVPPKNEADLKRETK